MGVDMDHADRPLRTDCFQDRIGDRVVAADGQRRDAGLDNRPEGLLDILVAALQRITRAERDIADIGGLEHGEGRSPQRMVHRPHALDRTDGARAEAGAGTVGHAKIHRHADDRDIEPAEAGRGQRVGAIGSPDEGRDIREGPFALVAGELGRSHLGEMRIVNIAASGPDITLPQLRELVLIHAGLRFTPFSRGCVRASPPARSDTRPVRSSCSRACAPRGRRQDFRAR